jgi:type IV secretion system protein VirB10
MSDENVNRRDAIISEPSSGSGRVGTLGIVLFLLAIGVAAYVLLFREEGVSTAPGTSDSADIQNPETRSGVDTNMLRGDEPETTLDTSAPTTQMPPPAMQVVMTDDEGDAARDRIVELERQIEALRAAQGDNPDFETSLRVLRDELNAQFDRERAALEENYQLQLAELTRQMSPGGNVGVSDEERDARARLEAERQRRAAILEAQIMSDGIVIDSSTARAGSGGGAEGGGATRRLSSNEAFVAQASTQSYDTVSGTRIAAPDRTIVQGTTLNAVLETAISTELPGVIRAVVTDDVRSYDGANVLLPRGTRLIGSYNSDVSVIQDRVQMAWNRAVTPEGVSVELGGYGSDALGRSGQDGFTDTRFRQRFGSAALISLIGAGPEVVVNESSGGAASDAAEDVGDDLSTATQGVMGDYLSAGPVIYIDQGTYMTVFVNRDIVL